MIVLKTEHNFERRTVMLKSRGGREENEKLLLSVKETCGLTGLSERIVRTLMRNGWKNRRLEYFSGTC